MTSYGTVTIERSGFDSNGVKGKLQLVSTTKNTNGYSTQHNTATRIVIKVQNNTTVKTRNDVGKVTILLYNNNGDFIKSTDISSRVLGGINQSHHVIAGTEVHDSQGNKLKDINGDDLHAEELTIDLFNDDIANFFTTNVTGTYNETYKYKISAIDTNGSQDYISNMESIGWLDIDGIVDTTPRLLNATSTTQSKLKFVLNTSDQKYIKFKSLFNESDMFNIPDTNLHLDAVLKIGNSEETISNVGIAGGDYEKDYTSEFAPGSAGGAYDKVESLVARLQLNNNSIAYASKYIGLGTNGVVVLEPKAEVVRNLETYFDTDSKNIVVRYKIPENKVTDSAKPITKYRIFYTDDSNTVESIENFYNPDPTNYDDTNIWKTKDITNNLTNTNDQFENVLPATSIAMYEDKLVAVTVAAYTGAASETHNSAYLGVIRRPSTIYKPAATPAYLSSNLTTSLGTSDKKIQVQVPVNGNGLINYSQYNGYSASTLNNLFKINYELTVNNSTSQNFDVTGTSNTTEITRTNYDYVTLTDLKAQRKMLRTRTGIFSGNNFNLHYDPALGPVAMINIDTNKIAVQNPSPVKTYPKIDINSLTAVKGASTKSDGTPYDMLELRGESANVSSLQNEYNLMNTTQGGKILYDIQVKNNTGDWNNQPGLSITFSNNKVVATLGSSHSLLDDQDYTNRIKARLVFKGNDTAALNNVQNIDSTFHIVTADSVVSDSTKGNTAQQMLTPWSVPTITTINPTLITTAVHRSSDKKYDMNFNFSSLDLSTLQTWPTKIKVTIADNGNLTGGIEEEVAVTTPSANTSVNILVNSGFEYNRLYYYKIEVLIQGLTTNSAYTSLSTLVDTRKTVELTIDTDNSDYKIPTDGKIVTSISQLTSNSVEFKVNLEDKVQDIFGAYFNSLPSIPSNNKLELQLQRLDGSSNWVNQVPQIVSNSINGWIDTPIDHSGNPVTVSLTKSSTNVYDFEDYTFSNLTVDKKYRVKYTMKYNFGGGITKSAYGPDAVTSEVLTYGTPNLTSISDNGPGSIKVKIDGNGRAIEGASLLVSDNSILKAATISATPVYNAEETEYIFTWLGMGQIKTAIITIQPGHLSAVSQPPMEVYIVKRNPSTNSWDSIQHLTAL